jgi:hypothetical protein
MYEDDLVVIGLDDNECTVIIEFRVHRVHRDNLQRALTGHPKDAKRDASSRQGT